MSARYHAATISAISNAKRSAKGIWTADTSALGTATSVHSGKMASVNISLVVDRVPLSIMHVATDVLSPAIQGRIAIHVKRLVSRNAPMPAFQENVDNPSPPALSHVYGRVNTEVNVAFLAVHPAIGYRAILAAISNSNAVTNVHPFVGKLVHLVGTVKHVRNLKSSQVLLPATSPTAMSTWTAIPS